MECDVKHNESFTYTLSYPLIVTSNYTLDHIGKNDPVEAEALRNRSREIFLFAKMVDTVEELNDCRQRGEAAVMKPHFNILPEVLCGLFEQYFTETPEAKLMTNSELQTIPPGLFEKFRENELNLHFKKMK